MIYSNDRDPNVTDWEAMGTDAATEPAYPLQYHEATNPAQMFGISEQRETEIHEQLEELGTEDMFDYITTATEPEGIELAIKASNRIAQAPNESAYIFYITGKFIGERAAEEA